MVQRFVGTVVLSPERFPLVHTENHIRLWWDDLDIKLDWLARAESVFHAFGFPLDEDLYSRWGVRIPVLHMVGALSQSVSKSRLRQQQAVYLFVSPPVHILPTTRTPSSLHFWSFFEDGRSPLSTSMCQRLGLPVVLQCEIHFQSFYWDNDTYKIIRLYQAARGFDPTTADFAQSFQDPDPLYLTAKDDFGRTGTLLVVQEMDGSLTFSVDVREGDEASDQDDSVKSGEHSHPPPQTEEDDEAAEQDESLVQANTRLLHKPKVRPRTKRETSSL
ncbi:hypothetical protein V5O48_009241 [Marasmius crinis-equi]|uniref:Aminotransferase-like plant mobile domain-containing protein n=1 Tax=Marasmius crinis-equi TaxID=585013 RepID=A0ABR3FBN7_9AGAR